MDKQLKLLTAILIILGGLVFYVMQSKQNQLYEGEQLLLPELQDDGLIAKIDRIEFKHRQYSFYLNKKQGTWRVNDGFYADMEPLIELVQSLQNAGKLEAKTNNPKNFKRLQISDDDWSLQVFANNRRLAALYLGKSGYAADTLFVRMAGELQSWLVDEFKPLNYEVEQWQLKNVLNIAPEQVQSLVIKYSDGENLSLTKDYDSGLLQLKHNTAENLKNTIDSTKLEANLASGLSHFIVEYAEPNKLTATDDLIVLKYQLNDGQTVVVKLFQTNQDSYWAIIDNDKYRNWQLKIPEFKFKQFSQTITELTQR